MVGMLIIEGFFLSFLHKHKMCKVNEASRQGAPNDCIQLYGNI